MTRPGPAPQTRAIATGNPCAGTAPAAMVRPAAPGGTAMDPAGGPAAPAGHAPGAPGTARAGPAAIPAACARVPAAPRAAAMEHSGAGARPASPPVAAGRPGQLAPAPLPAAIAGPETPITRAEARLSARIARWSAAMGRRVEPAPGLCALRTRLLGLPAPGRVSANGACRLIRAADGWLAVNLPRGCDRDLVPALLGHGCPAADPWPVLEAALPHRPAAEVVAQAALLGLAVARVGEAGGPPPGGGVLPAGAGRASCLPDRSGGACNRPGRAGEVPWIGPEDPGLPPASPLPPCPRDRAPRVVDLSALWAGPLCGALLAQAGCEVVKAETLQRPDTTAERSPAFDALLNGGKRRWRMDRDSPQDRARLRALLAGADAVITNARPRALHWLPAALPPRCLWIAIRAHADPHRIGFGDDCAAAGGLVGWQDGPLFLGDAAADPLTGLAAAAIALRALALRQGGRVEVLLSAVAAEAAHG